MPHHHRASSLRQSNKPFKSRHSSKSALKQASKGRAASAQDGGASRASSHKASPLSAAGNSSGSRHHRRNLAKQSQSAKRAALVQSNRVFNANLDAASHPHANRGLAKGFAGAGGGAPRICAVVALTDDVDSWAAVERIQRDADDGALRPVDGRSVQDARTNRQPFCELETLRFRQTLQFLPLPYGALYPILDACKCADFVVLLLSASTSIEPGSWGELCLRTLQAQGLPTTLVAVPTLLPDGAAGVGGSKKAGPTQKAANEARKSLLSFAQYFSPDVDKVHALDDAAERGALVRTLATATPKRVAWRDFRAWTVAEGAEWIPSSEAEEEVANGDDDDAGAKARGPRGTLKVEGWIRGAPLSANRLVHIPDFGDFEVEKITYAPPPNARLRRRTKASDGDAANDREGDEEMGDAEQGGETEAGDVLDSRDSEYADDLVSENEADDLQNEQTWPTEEEMAAGEAFARSAGEGEAAMPPAMPGTTPKSIQKKNKGAKDAADDPKFRAAWIIESDGEEEDGESEDEQMDDDEELEGGSGDEAVEEAVNDYEAAKAAALAGAGAGAGAGGQGSDEVSEAVFSDVDEAEAAASLLAYQEQQQQRRRERLAAKEDAEFPDEVDTPADVAARVRFARYRGLKSMRTSPWDPYEDLPRDYARIFQFEDFHKTRRRVEAAALLEGVEPGYRVKVWVKGVPWEAAKRAGVREPPTQPPQQGKEEGDAVPFVIFGLLRHEHKKSVVNFTVTRNTEYSEPVRSKDELVLCLGARRMRVRPIFSQHSRGGGKGVNNVHKFERYLKHGVSSSIGTIYGPITFGGSTAPAVLLRERMQDGQTGWDQRGVGARQMPHLVGFGNLVDAGPTRINAKRILLSGHPFKVHKKTATIRFMFFNPEDVHYFAPVALTTKMGRTGHVVESLGTHGYFKAHFDGALSQMDTVLMPLYKRVFPKWAEPFRESRDEMPIKVAEGEAQTEEIEME
ncbi:ribosome biogenesis protein tsr1 [Thecaphora frezii]